MRKKDLRIHVVKKKVLDWRGVTMASSSLSIQHVRALPIFKYFSSNRPLQRMPNAGKICAFLSYMALFFLEG
jgi:hypothetical protein